jgi:hypothetical protein
MGAGSQNTFSEKCIRIIMVAIEEPHSPENRVTDIISRVTMRTVGTVFGSTYSAEIIRRHYRTDKSGLIINKPQNNHIVAYCQGDVPVFTKT